MPLVKQLRASIGARKHLRRNRARSSGPRNKAPLFLARRRDVSLSSGPRGFPEAARRLWAGPRALNHRDVSARGGASFTSGAHARRGPARAFKGGSRSSYGRPYGGLRASRFFRSPGINCGLNYSAARTLGKLSPSGAFSPFAPPPSSAVFFDALDAPVERQYARTNGCVLYACYGICVITRSWTLMGIGCSPGCGL